MRIYSIVNKITGKQYIGQTVQSLEKRFKQHCHESSNSRYLHAAICKYGKENFKIQELSQASSKEELDKLESEAIISNSTLVPDGYNLTTGGAAPRHSKITKQKMSDTRKGKHPHWATEASHSVESNQKRVSSRQLNGFAGHTEKTKQLMKQRASSRMKAVMDDLGEVYQSIADAHRKTGCNRAGIQRVLAGKYKKIKGKDRDFVFTYVQ